MFSLWNFLGTAILINCTSLYCSSFLKSPERRGFEFSNIWQCSSFLSLVSEHENEPEKQYIEPGSISTEIKRREDWKKSLQNRLEVESQDSLDEYGGNTPYFTEEGSFVGDLTKGNNRRSIYDEISSPAV